MKNHHPGLAVARAAEVVGSQAALARAIGVAAPTVNQLVKEIRPVSEKLAVSIERVTKGVVTCEEMLPNSKWHRVADSFWPHPSGRPVRDFSAEPPGSKRQLSTQEVNHG